MNPRVLFDFPRTIHQFSSAIMAGPFSAPRWAGRKTGRIGSAGGKGIALAEAPTHTSKKCSVHWAAFPGSI